MRNDQCVVSYDQGLSFTADCLSQGKINEREIASAIREALVFYDLPTEFDLQVKSENDSDCDPASPYCCKLGAYDAETEQYVVIRFPERRSYVLGKMWFMLVSMVAILGLILVVFFLAIRALMTQRRITQFNVDFFNSMAHEFRTPLSNIKLALGRMSQKEMSSHATTYLNIIAGESHKLNNNVERVLSLAKIEDGGYELRKEQVSLRRLLDMVLKDLLPVIKESNAEVIIHPNIEGVSVWADPLHIAHAFRNLIDNSIKYCDQKPKIEIDLKKVKSGIMLVFKDNGVGIDAENKKIIFDRFRRLDHGGKIKGFGLGLSYVKMIVDLHRGKINLFSQSGRGSRFELFFPQMAS